MSEKTAIVPFERIAAAIHIVRGQKVMLDRDWAVLYGVEIRALNQAVKRNIERFPSDFMLELTREEIRNISQSVICSATLKHAPKVFAFTKQGVAMLSGVLHSPQAVAVIWNKTCSFQDVQAQSDGEDLNNAEDKPNGIAPPFFPDRNDNLVFGDKHEVRSFTDIWEGGRPGLSRRRSERGRRPHRLHFRFFRIARTPTLLSCFACGTKATNSMNLRKTSEYAMKMAG